MTLGREPEIGKSRMSEGIVCNLAGSQMNVNETITGGFTTSSGIASKVYARLLVTISIHGLRHFRHPAERGPAKSISRSPKTKVPKRFLSDLPW
jgi:hypothetical protein